MANLLLLRHGEIAANVEGLWHGSTDSPLTRRGRRQVKRTARHIDDSHPEVAAIYSSPLERCLSTSSTIADALGMAPMIHPDLREYAIGEWEGTAHRELAEQFDFVNRAIADPEFAPPGGESLREVAERTIAALAEINTMHRDDAQVLVVCHGAGMAVALGVILEGHHRNWVDYQLANCGLTELVLSESPYVNFFNSTNHL